MKKYVITGGPHAGKSTILRKLQKQGHPCVEEAALLVIERLNDTIGIDAQIRWRDDNQLDFQQLVSTTQIKNELQLNTSNHKVCFLDRGLHDGLAYMNFHNKTPPEAYLTQLENTSYETIFLMDLVTPYDERGETGRTLNQQAAEKISNALHQVYTNYGYNVIKVPMLALDERVAFVLNHI